MDVNLFEENKQLHDKVKTLEEKLVRQVEERIELQHKEKTLHSVFDVTQVGICIIDENGKFVDVNNAYCKIYGYEKEELIGKPFTIVVPKDYQLTAQQLLDEFIRVKSEIPKEWKVQRRDGSLLDVVVTAGFLIDDEGNRFSIETF